IRGFHVTAVQTCALPIYEFVPYFSIASSARRFGFGRNAKLFFSKYDFPSGGSPNQNNSRGPKRIRCGIHPEKLCEKQHSLRVLHSSAALSYHSNPECRTTA